MPWFSARALRPAIAATALLACAEGAPPTQPVDVTPLATIPKGSADVIVADLPSTIDACLIAGKGLIYRIKTQGAPDECAKNDIAFSWVAAGVPGPQGPMGPQGPQGSPGAQGPAGAALLTGSTFHSQGVTLPADGRFLTSCPAGKSVVNFGWDIPFGTSTAQASQIRGVRPAFNGTQITWGFVAAPGTLYQFYWTCANAEPAALAP